MSPSQSKRSKSLGIYRAEHESRIVRVGCQSGGKDRHSKVLTTKGPRDRRVRLSVPTAIDFYDLQDRLKFEHPSGVIDWLITEAKNAIDKLPPLPEEFSSSVNVIQEGSSCASPGPLDEVSGNQASLKQVESNLSSDFGRSTGSVVTEVTEPVKYGDIETPKSVLRTKRREKARERAKKKPNIENRHEDLVNQPSISETVTGLISNSSSPEEVAVWKSYMDMLCSQESTTMSHQQQQQQLHHMTSSSSPTASSAPTVATPIPRYFSPFLNGSSANPQSSQVGHMSLDHKFSRLGGNSFQQQQQQQQLQPNLQFSIMRSIEEQNQHKQLAPTIFSNMDMNMNSLSSLYFRGPLQSNDNNINVPMPTLVKNASHDYMDSRPHHAYNFA